MTWNLFIDDERHPKDVTWAPWFRTTHPEEWVICRSLEEVDELVKLFGCPKFITFDHDLGTSLSGYDIAKMLVQYDMDGVITIPQDFDYAIHSKNPVGSANIASYLFSYLNQRNS